MPEESGTSSHVIASGRSDGAHVSRHQERPGQLRRDSRNPQHDLNKLRKHVQDDAKKNYRSGHVASAQLNRNPDGTKLTLTPPSGSASSARAKPTPPNPDDDEYTGEAGKAKLQIAIATYSMECSLYATADATAAASTTDADKYLRENSHKMIVTLLAFCHDDLLAEIKGDSRFSGYETAGDIVGMYDLVEEKACGLGKGTHPYHAFLTHLKNLLLGWQKGGVSLAAYREEKDSARSLLHRIAGNEAAVAPRFVVLKVLEESLSSDEIKELKWDSDVVKKAEKTAEERIMVFVYLYNANRRTFGEAILDKEKDYVKAADDDERAKVFGHRIDDIMDYLSNARVARQTGRPDDAAGGHTGAQFHMSHAVLGGDAKVDETEKTGCVHCANTTLTDAEKAMGKEEREKKPHHTTECPLLSEAEIKELEGIRKLVVDRVGVRGLQRLLSHDSEGGMRSETSRNVMTRILLDNCATVSTADPVLVDGDVAQAPKSTIVACNAGWVVLDEEMMLGEFKFLAKEGSEENVLAMDDLVAAGYHVQFDSSWRDQDGRGYYKVFKGGMMAKVYKDVRDGLPSFDIAGLSPRDDFVMRGAVPGEAAQLRNPQTNIHVQTLKQRIDEVGLTAKEYERAKRAYQLQERVGNVSSAEFENLVVSNTAFRNSNLGLQDVKNANAVFGPHRISSLKGKTTRRAPKHVDADYVAIPRDFLELQKNVALVADVMFVNNLPFLITMSRRIRFVTVEHIKSRTAKQLSNSLKRVMRVYGRAGLTVQTIFMDIEFESTVDALLDSTVVNTSAAKEHVAEIERTIRTSKEKCRCTISRLPFESLPKLMVISVVYHEVMWGNAFPKKLGVSQTYSPRAIVLRSNLDVTLHARYDFGQYGQVADEPDPSNTMVPRTQGAIYVGSSGNFQGSMKFFLLKSAKIVKRRQFTPLDMPKSAVDRVNEIGRRSHRTTYGRDLSYRNRLKERYEWDHEDDMNEMLGVADKPEEQADFPGIRLAINDSDDRPTAVEPETLTERELIAASAANQATTFAEGQDLNQSAVTAGESSGIGHDIETGGCTNDDLDVRGPEVRSAGADVSSPSTVMPGPPVTPAVPHEPAEATLSESGDGDGEEDTTSETDTGDEEEEEQLGRGRRVRKPVRRYGTNYNKKTKRYEYQDGGEEKVHVQRSRKVADIADDPTVKTSNLTPASKAERKRLKKLRQRQRKAEAKAKDAELQLLNEQVKAVKPEREQHKRRRANQRASQKRKRRSQVGTCEEGASEPFIVSPSVVLGKSYAQRECKKLTEEETDTYVLGLILAQFSLKKGLEAFGDRGEGAVSKELNQFHELQCFYPIDPTREQRRKALPSLMFLKEKRPKPDEDEGEVKARGCIVGTPQREYIKKEDATSPTAMLDSLFIVASINAYEKRKTATMDVPGAFLQTETDEDVVMALEGTLAELMVKIDPKIYRKHVTTNKKGKPVLYVKLNKAMYGLLRSALLFYRKFRKVLEGYGFEVNPYDPCVANAMINGSQMTAIWHVDDVHVSHADDFEITKLGHYLSGVFGGLSVRRGLKHDFLGINFDYSRAETEGVVVVDQIPYIRTILQDFPERLGRSKATPAADHLFTVRAEDEAKYLPEEQADIFHRFVAQLLFIAPRARKDIQTAISFLTTRVKRPDEDDWGKLRRVLEYLKGTRNLKLTLKVKDLSVIRWWIDASYTVHPDCKGHTGSTMTLGEGATISMSNKQKVNVRSSTEGELVGVHDVLPRALWSKYFIEAQGFKVDRNIVYQDNKSAILLEKNGKFSSSKRTKHIKTHYFLIKDKIEQGDLEVEHCPTDKMWSDGHTKPKQGAPFRIDRAAVMNCPVDYSEDESKHEDLDMVSGKAKPDSCVFVKLNGNRIPVKTMKA